MLNNALLCSICRHPVFTRIEGNIEVKLSDLLSKLSIHFQNKHKEQLDKITEQGKILLTYAGLHYSLNTLAKVPDTNEDVSNYQDELDNILQEGLNLTLEDNEEIEDEDTPDELDIVLARLSDVMAKSDEDLRKEVSDILEELLDSDSNPQQNQIAEPEKP